MILKSFECRFSKIQNSLSHMYLYTYTKYQTLCPIKSYNSNFMSVFCVSSLMLVKLFFLFLTAGIPGETCNALNETEWNSAKLFNSWGSVKCKHLNRHAHTHTTHKMILHAKSKCPFLPYLPWLSTTAFQIKAVVSECYQKTLDCALLWISEMSDALWREASNWLNGRQKL